MSMPMPLSPGPPGPAQAVGVRGPSAQRLFQHRLFQIAALVIVLSGCLVALALAYMRSQEVESGERLTESFAQVIEEQTTRTFQFVDQTLLLAATNLTQMQLAGTLNEGSARALLRNELKTMPFVRILWVTDATGRLIYNSELDSMGVNLSDTAYFKFLQNQPQASFHVSAPVKSRIDGKWLIPAARPLRSSTGVFIGTIAAAVDPHYFDKLWKSIDLGADGSVALFRRDGVLLMRTPFDESVMGKSYQGRPLFRELLAKNPADSYPDTSPIDGHVRLFSYRGSATSPDFVILVGQSFEAILAPWHRLVWLTLALWVVSCITVIMLCLVLNRAWQRRLATEDQLRHSEVNLAITLQSIGDAVIATDASGLVTRMNSTAERMTGWPLAEALGQPLAEVFRIINAQTRAPSINPVQLVMKHGEVVGLANHTALLARDGREYQISDSAAPIRDEVGQIVGVVLVFSDVTEDYRMRQALSNTTEMLERTGKLAKVGGWETDVRTGATFWSEQTFHMLELDPPVVPATTQERMRFYAPQVHAMVMAAAQAAFEHGTPWDMDLPMITAKGRHFWARVQGFVAMEDGKAIKVSGTFQDISERKQAEAALRQSEARFRSSFDSAGIGMSVSGLDGQWIQVNPRLCEIVGYAETDMLQMSFQDITHPDDLASDLARVQDLMAGISSYFHMEKRYIHHDGHTVWINLTVSLVRDANGTPLHTVAHMEDISERKQLEYNLRQSERGLHEAAQHTQAILDNMVDGVITISVQGIMESFNRAASTLFGYMPEEVLGHNVSMLMPEPHKSQHNGYLLQHLQTGVNRTVGTPREMEGRRKDGSLFPISLSVSEISRAGQTTFIGLVRDITQQRKDVEEIRRLAFYDPLTGLPNRRLLMDRLRHAMLTSERTSQHGALMFLDLDHFKLLNDTQGHGVGDVLLQQVSTRIQTCVREGDSVARLGGDEFVILLEALSTQAHEAATQAEVVANKIRDAFGQAFTPRGHPYDSTPSIGIVMFLGDHESKDDLLKKADVAMYQAKAAGRNTVRFFDPAMQAAVAAHDALEKDMRRGLVRHEFVLHYQIQVNGSGTLTGVEALVRWNHPQEGMMSPGGFIPLAEETGLILPLGQWVLETACEQLVQWARQPDTAQWTVAVNVSASQFTQADFVANVGKALQKTGADAHKLKLELTESTLVNDVDDVVTKMNAIKAYGVGFSLDDFGTGYSSLSYLKRLPLDHLKIDQSFVRDVLTDPSDAVIARTIVALGHSLGLTVIAEGVETAEQRDFLLEAGCDAFQGYYFGHPAPAQTLV